jgi:hypothetical protein
MSHKVCCSCEKPENLSEMSKKITGLMFLAILWISSIVVVVIKPQVKGFTLENDVESSSMVALINNTCYDTNDDHNTREIRKALCPFYNLGDVDDYDVSTTTNDPYDVLFMGASLLVVVQCLACVFFYICKPCCGIGDLKKNKYFNFAASMEWFVYTIFGFVLFRATNKDLMLPVENVWDLVKLSFISITLYAVVFTTFRSNDRTWEPKAKSGTNCCGTYLMFLAVPIAMFILICIFFGISVGEQVTRLTLYQNGDTSQIEESEDEKQLWNVLAHVTVYAQLIYHGVVLFLFIVFVLIQVFTVNSSNQQSQQGVEDATLLSHENSTMDNPSTKEIREQSDSLENTATHKDIFQILLRLVIGTFSTFIYITWLLTSLDPKKDVGWVILWAILGWLLTCVFFGAFYYGLFKCNCTWRTKPSENGNGDTEEMQDMSS